MMLKLILPFFLVAMVFASACVTQQGEKRLADGTIVKPDGTMIKPDGTMIKPDGTMILPNGTMVEPENKSATSVSSSYSGTILAGSSAPVIDFNKADYDRAIASDKIVFLYFYATWCPICRAEAPEFYSAFNEIKSDKIVAFRINFNDGDTDADEKALAQQFQVPYQHTKIILKDDKVFLKAPDSWDKARYLSEINKVL